MLLRLDRIISEMGYATRSEAAELIRRGRVTVDGNPVQTGSKKIDPEQAVIAIDGTVIKYEKYSYLMMNKPAGYITATSDKQERTVMELLETRYRRIGLFPAGRLDKDAQGLLLLTNDGEFAHNVISPSRKVRKKYYVKIEGSVSKEDVEEFSSGLTLGDGTKCAPALLEPIGDGEVFVTLTEGKYHQVKRMLSSVGAHVVYLERVSIGGLKLDSRLTPGEYKILTKCEIDIIFDKL